METTFPQKTKITIEVEIDFHINSRERLTSEETHLANELMLTHIVEDIKSTITNSTYYEIISDEIGDFCTITDIKAK